MENLSIYEAVRQPPQNALKKIQGGRLSGKTDINPMWRIKTLTEQFGVCGIGWYYMINKQWLEEGANGEVAAFCNISLYVKIGDEWSKPIEGTGGSAFTAKEKSGLRSDDDCYKKALTDAISVSCKALGIAADVYWNEDTTKYSVDQAPPPAQNRTIGERSTKEQWEEIDRLVEQTKTDRTKMLGYYKVKDVTDMNFDTAKNCIANLKAKLK